MVKLWIVGACFVIWKKSSRFAQGNRPFTKLISPLQPTDLPGIAVNWTRSFGAQQEVLHLNWPTVPQNRSLKKTGNPNVDLCRTYLLPQPRSTREKTSPAGRREPNLSSLCRSCCKAGPWVRLPISRHPEHNGNIQINYRRSIKWRTAVPHTKRAIMLIMYAKSTFRGTIDALHFMGPERQRRKIHTMALMRVHCEYCSTRMYVDA